MTIPVAVIVPVLNEADTIHELLGNLILQTRLPAEIIIVDAGSSDNTSHIIQAWWAQYGSESITLRTIDCPGAMPGRGRNEGTKAAQSPWIAFIDAGITPHADWLEQLWDCANELKQEAVFGTCEFQASGNLQLAVCALSYGVGAKHSVVPASLFSRNVFARAGFFREDLRCAEDQLWMQSVDKNYPRTNCRNALVTYTHFPKDLNSIARKWYFYQLHTVHAGTKKLQQLVYLYAPVLLALLWFTSTSYIICALVAYILVRGVIDPWRKSGYKQWWKGQSLAFFTAIFTVVIMDICKLSATLAAHLRLNSRHS